MKRLGWKMTGLVAGILLLGSGIVAHEEIGDGTQETTSGIPYEAQILKYGLDNLNTLKQVLPDLYKGVISPDWMEMEGSEKLQLVVKSVPNVWGANDEDVDDYLSRIDQYESKVPDGARENMGIIFGLMGEHLLRQVFYIEQHKENIQPLVEVYAILWEDEPGKLVDYEKCLDRTVVTMTTMTKSTFNNWLDGVEEIATDSDMFRPHASLQSETATELVNWYSTESIKAVQTCNPDWEADS